MNWTYRKPFEQDLHDEYDLPAKVAVAKFVAGKCEVEVNPNEDQYGVDLIVMRGDKQLGSIEVEVRQWSPTCPYSTIHIPERKQKFFGDNTLFFALTKDMKHAYWIQTKDIKQYPLREVRNVKVASGEFFFDVPTEDFTYVEFE
jgi:hypothetical protein